MTGLAAEIHAVLADRASPLAAIVKAVGAAERALADAPAVAIGLSSNVTIDLLGLFLRREAALAGIRARIVAGNYDDPIGDMARFAGEGVERVVLLPFFDNIMPAFEAQIASLDEQALDAKLAELQGRYALALQGANGFKSVHLGLYHRYGRAAADDRHDPVPFAIERFNAMLRDAASAHPNVLLLDVGAEVAEVGRAAAYDPRFYFRSKAPYAAPLLAALATRIARATRGFGTRFYKAIALDCDNTLWGGIIGEDLLGGIRLDPYDAPGSIFWRVQTMIAGLERQGLLLCLCTKNNPADVDEVFADHPHMALRSDRIVARRVNWRDKVSNLEELAAELNIGLDAMIFLDDNPVEIEAVRARLPMVHAVQVPAALPDYPAAIEEIAALFLAGGVSADGRAKTDQYRQRAAAGDAKAAFGSHEEYLASLGLEVELHIDRPAEAARISELSLKSNQFNLTTLRLSEPEVRARMESIDGEVISVTVRNRFGEAGLTGIVLLRFDGETARIENFLMSCRVLGQGAEFALWPHVADRARARGCTRIDAAFLPTPKNAQVADFWDRLGLRPASDEGAGDEGAGDGGAGRRYSAPLDGFAPPPSPWITVTHD